MEYLRGQIWTLKYSISLHVEVPMIEEEAMTDVVGSRIAAVLGDHRHVSDCHNKLFVDTRDPHRLALMIIMGNWRCYESVTTIQRQSF